MRVRRKALTILILVGLFSSPSPKEERQERLVDLFKMQPGLSWLALR